MISDDDILDLIELGSIRIMGIRSRDPVLSAFGRKQAPQLTSQRGRFRIADGQARWTWRFRWNGKRRRIVRSKLVYMCAHHVVIPADWVVHHKDGDRLNDAIDNLEVLHVDAHKLVHATDRDRELMALEY